MLRRGRRLLILAIFALCITGFSGCSLKETRDNKSDEEILGDRIMAYWNHKINGEFDKSYPYEDGLYRKRVNMVNYIRSFKTAKANWTGASIDDIKIEGDEYLILREDEILGVLG